MKLLIPIAILIISCSYCSQAQAQSFAVQNQGVFRAVRGKINRYRNGGIYAKPGISPYYRVLRNTNSTPYAYRAIRSLNDGRRSAIDNRLTIKRTARPMGFDPSGRASARSPLNATGSGARFMTYQ